MRCAIVWRSTNRIQHYCYDNKQNLIENSIKNVYNETSIVYEWCIHATGCKPSKINWDVQYDPDKLTMKWQATVDQLNIKSDVFHQIYGVTACMNPPATGVMKHPETGEPTPYNFYTANGVRCVSFYDKQLSWISACGEFLGFLFSRCVPGTDEGLWN